jgi:hypothetical protein
MCHLGNVMAAGWRWFILMAKDGLTARLHNNQAVLIVRHGLLISQLSSWLPANIPSELVLSWFVFAILHSMRILNGLEHGSSLYMEAWLNLPHTKTGRCITYRYCVQSALAAKCKIKVKFLISTLCNMSHMLIV